MPAKPDAPVDFTVRPRRGGGPEGLPQLRAPPEGAVARHPLVRARRSPLVGGFEAHNSRVVVRMDADKQGLRLRADFNGSLCPQAFSASPTGRRVAIGTETMWLFREGMSATAFHEDVDDQGTVMTWSRAGQLSGLQSGWPNTAPDGSFESMREACVRSRTSSATSWETHVDGMDGDETVLGPRRGESVG